MSARLIDAALLDSVIARAQASPRRRMNHNFHPDDAHPAHRLLNAIEPDSYVRPHRHLDPLKDETILCLRGRLGCVLFEDAGAVQSLCLLAPTGRARHRHRLRPVPQPGGAGARQRHVRGEGRTVPRPGQR